MICLQTIGGRKLTSANLKIERVSPLKLWSAFTFNDFLIAFVTNLKFVSAQSLRSLRLGGQYTCKHDHRGGAEHAE
jgi:hypothetical protein